MLQCSRLAREENDCAADKLVRPRQSFVLRLEVFEQQYLAKVADIQREMHAAIQHERARAEGVILAATEQLKAKTQRAAVATVTSAEMAASAALTRDDSRLSSNTESFSMSATMSNRPRERPRSTLETSFKRCANDDDNLRRLSWDDRHRRKMHHANQEDAGDDKSDAPQELSPVARQRAKLRALEAKLASFSQDSVDRITHELKNGSSKSRSSRVANRTSSLRKQSSSSRQAEQATESTDGDRITRDVSLQDAARMAWTPTPLSPLRKNRSYWRNGISREHRCGAADENSSRADTERNEAERPPLGRGALSSRFLRPEEERELRHLRNSIGMAKDWMEQHC